MPHATSAGSRAPSRWRNIGRRCAGIGRKLLRLTAAAAVLLCAVVSFCCELLGEGWVLKEWVAARLMGLAGIRFSCGEWRQDPVSGEFAIKDFSVSASNFDGDFVSVDFRGGELHGWLDVKLFPVFAVNLRRVTVADAEFEAKICFDVDESVPDPPSFFDTFDPETDAMTVLPSPEIGEGERGLGLPFFMPEIAADDLKIDRLNAAIEWRHRNGTREVVEFRGVGAEIRRCVPDEVNHLIFTADGGNFDSEFADMSSGPFRGTIRWEFTPKTFVRVLGLESDLTEYRLNMLGLEWPESQVSAWIRSEGCNFIFDRIRAESCRDGGVSSFDISGAINTDYFWVMPGSVFICAGDILEQLTGRSGREDFSARTEISGFGNFRRGFFSASSEYVFRSGWEKSLREFYGRVSCDHLYDVEASELWFRNVGAVLNSGTETGAVIEISQDRDKYLGYDFREGRFLSAGGFEISASGWGDALRALCPGDADSAVRPASGVAGGHWRVTGLPGGAGVRIDGETAVEGLLFGDRRILDAPADFRAAISAATDDMRSWRVELPEAVLADPSGEILRGAGSLLWDGERAESAAEFVVRPEGLGIAKDEAVAAALKSLGAGEVRFSAAGEAAGRSIALRRMEIGAGCLAAEFFPVEVSLDGALPPLRCLITCSEWVPEILGAPVSGVCDLTLSGEGFDWAANFSGLNWDVGMEGGGSLDGEKFRIRKLEAGHPEFGRWRSGEFSVLRTAGGWICPGAAELTAEVEPGRIASVLGFEEEVSGVLSGRVSITTPEAGTVTAEIGIGPAEDGGGVSAAGIRLEPELTGRVSWTSDGEFSGGGSLNSAGGAELASRWRLNGRLPRFELLCDVEKFRMADPGIDDVVGTLSVTGGEGAVLFSASGSWSWREKFRGRLGLHGVGDAGSLEVRELFFRAEDASGGGELLRVSAAGVVPFDPEEAITVSAETAFSLPELERVLDAGEEDSAENNRWAETGLDFGSRLQKISLSLRDCEIIPGMTVSGPVSLTVVEDVVEAESKEARLNDGRLVLVFRAEGLDTPEKKFSCSGRVEDLTCDFLLPDNNGMKCRELVFAGSGLLTGNPEFADRLAGEVSGRFADIHWENKFFNSITGKILLLPVEAYLRIYSLLPEIDQKLLGYSDIGEDFLRVYAHTGVLKFDNAVLRARTENSMVEISECVLSGSVHELRLPGRFGWGSRNELELDVGYCAGGVVLPMSLTGTVDEPVPRWDESCLRLVGENIQETGTRLFKGVKLLIPWF